jgi:hypothetical protein
MVLRRIQIDDLVESLRDARARDVMPGFRDLAPEEVEAKSHALDLVTVADRPAEARIRVEEAGGRAAVDGAVPYAPTCREGWMVAASFDAMGRRILRLAFGA